MLLFFDFGRLLWGHTIGAHGPAARLARVLDDFPSVELVMIRWTVGTLRRITSSTWPIGPSVPTHTQSARSRARCAAGNNSIGLPLFMSAWQAATSAPHRVAALPSCSVAMASTMRPLTVCAPRWSVL